MGGIEVLEREAAAERAGQNTEALKAKVIKEEAMKLDTERRFAEAQIILVGLNECGIKLQAIYDKVDRSGRDRLYTVLQQVWNSQEELRQVYPNLAKREGTNGK